MTLVTDVTPGVEVVGEAQSLSSFTRASCAAALWNRSLPTEVETWLDSLDPDLLPDGRVILTADQVAETLTYLFDEVGTPAGAERTWLEQDMAALASQFMDLMSCPAVRLRLDVVATNACRKFHMDAIRARLICTYRGTGTQFGLSVAGAEPERIQTTPLGAPILLKGTLWPSSQGNTQLLHRSPPIEGTGETRLLLVLDPVMNPERAD